MRRTDPVQFHVYEPNDLPWCLQCRRGTWPNEGGRRDCGEGIREKGTTSAPQCSRPGQQSSVRMSSTTLLACSESVFAWNVQDGCLGGDEPMPPVWLAKSSPAVGEARAKQFEVVWAPQSTFLLLRSSFMVYLIPRKY